MEKLVIYPALNGVLVLTVSPLSGLFLYLAIRDDREQVAWHLLHADGTGRGVMLIALTAIIKFPVLPFWQLATMVWLVIIFTWTSMFAMGIRADSGERGLRLTGTITNKIVYILYALGTIAIFPACALLIYGFIKAI